MKSIGYFLLLGLVLLTSCVDLKTSSDESTASVAQREFYQLKTYTLANDAQVAMTDQYLQAAYIPGLKKQGIAAVGAFKPRPAEGDSLKQIWVLVPFASMDQFLAHEPKLLADPAYMTAGSAYLNAPYDQPPYLRIESVLLEAFPDMPMMATPKLDGPRADRVYELRSYESATEAIHRNKVDMFNAGGEVKLFDRLGFNAVFYASVLSGDKMPNLMYMTTFSDQASREEHWNAFRDAPEWLKLKAMPEYQNNVSHIDIHFLYPTEYSDY